MKNASPPRFRYEDRGNKIIIEYISKRGLIELAIGIAKAVGDYYDERIKVNKVSDDKFEIIFS
jgi:methyl-accepting chemotaxis protein